MQAVKSAKHELFCARLRSAVGSSGITQARLARDIGAHPVSMNRWLKDRVPDYQTTMKLAARLGVRLKWLLTGEEPKEPSEEEKALATSRLSGGTLIGECVLSEEPADYGAQSEAIRLQREIMQRLEDASLSQDELAKETLHRRVDEYFKVVEKRNPKAL